MDVPKPFIFQDDMLFESQFIIVRVESVTKKYYESLFSETLSVGQEIDVLIGWLPKRSRKVISVVCPRCKETREVKFSSLTKCDSSFCNLCSKQKRYDWMLGKTIGRLTVTGFGSGKRDINGKFKSTFICSCECGNEVEVAASDLKKGNTTSCGCYKKERFYEIHSGKNSPNYNNNLSNEERIIGRFIPEYKEWRKVIFRRDNYTCKVCGKNGVRLAAHHIVPYAINKKLRFDVDNGITLCNECHKEFHVNFMGGYKVKCDMSDLFNFILLKKKSNP